MIYKQIQLFLLDEVSMSFDIHTDFQAGVFVVFYFIKQADFARRILYKNMLL